MVSIDVVRLRTLILGCDCIIASLCIVIMLIACAPSQLRVKPVINAADVDVVSPGVRALVRTTGQVDLNKDPRIVCEKRVPTGSHLTKVICMTRAEKAILKEESEKELREIQDAQEGMEDLL